MTSALLLNTSAQRTDGGVRKLTLDPNRRISRTEAGGRCTPTCNRAAVQRYHELAIKYLPRYREAFYVWRKGRRIIDLKLMLPESHLPVIQEIREQFHRDRNKSAAIEWIKNNKEHLEGLLP